MVSSILESTLSGQLTDRDQEAIKNLFDTYRANQVSAWDIRALSDQRQLLAHAHDIYSKKVAAINPASFQFLNGLQKSVLAQELRLAFYLFSALYHLDEAEHRRQQKSARDVQIKHCADLIAKLEDSDKKPTPATLLADASNASEKHLKYLGLTIIAPFIAEKMQEFSTGKTSVIKEWMGELNGRRLYWIWGGGLLTSVISMLPDDFAGKQQAGQALAAPAPALGYISWILYYARFGINLSLLLKHTIAGPWMGDEEKKIHPWERFKTQWQARKLSLLNDSIWATANMVCFFWLTGGGMLGYMGNALTAGLLLLDISLTTWRFCEESTQHNKYIKQYEDGIAALQAKLVETKTDPDERAVLQLQLDALIKDKKQCEFDWKYKRYGIINDLVYAVGLLAAFSVLCSFFFPPAALLPATALILGVVGAALCFVLTITTAAVKGELEIAKSTEIGKNAAKDSKELLAAFNGCEEPSRKKQLYLDMQQLQATSDHQVRVIRFQKMSLVRAVLIDALIPPLVFVSFIFMPLGIGFGVLAAGFALAVLSHILLNRFEPKAESLPEFNEKAYLEFEKNPTLAALKGADVAIQPRFFAGNAGKNNAGGPDEALDDDKPSLGSTGSSSV